MADVRAEYPHARPSRRARQFHLYRVQLQPGLRTEPGYRDETCDEAAQLTDAQLRDAGPDAIRYLNAYEVRGTLSLAVVPEAIAAIQHVPIPLAAPLETADHATVLDERLGSRDLIVAQQKPTRPPRRSKAFPPSSASG